MDTTGTGRPFVARQRELAALESHFDTGRFELVVLYGRRRLGKTMLLTEFAKGRRCLFFTAQEKSDGINLASFSREVADFFGLGGAASFETWADALHFVARHAAAAGAGPMLLVFDEFPYAAKANESLPSTLQTAIDHEFLGINMTMVLCGSNQGFMEGRVLGSQSPLYGRRTAQMKLGPFDYLDTRAMLPDCSPREAVEYYAAFGGTPYYLAQISAAETFSENVARLFFDPYGLLYGEPGMLLRQELNEPALYASILDAVAAGATRPQAIADKAHVSQNSVGKYLQTLESLGIIERRVPLGENPAHSRRGVYRIADPFFAYWYRFVSPAAGAVETGAGGLVAAASTSGPDFDTYVGGRFEDVCLQWVRRQNALGRLGFVATSFGSWWGTDPTVRERADIDIVASDAHGTHVLLGECKWRNDFDETGAIETLERRASVVAGSAERIYVLFSKNPVSEGTRRKASGRTDLRLVDCEGLFILE